MMMMEAPFFELVPVSNIYKKGPMETISLCPQLGNGEQRGILNALLSCISFSLLLSDRTIAADSSIGI